MSKKRVKELEARLNYLEGRDLENTVAVAKSIPPSEDPWFIRECRVKSLDMAATYPIPGCSILLSADRYFNYLVYGNTTIPDFNFDPFTSEIKQFAGEGMPE